MVSLVKSSTATKLSVDIINCEKTLQGFAGGEYKCTKKIKDISITIDKQCFNADLCIYNGR